MIRHLLSVEDMSAEEIAGVLALARAMKASPIEFEDHLRGRSVLLLFAKPSMRTRLSFEVALAELGAHPISYRADESTLGEKETLADFGAVASRYAHAIVARLFAQSDLEELASRASVPVVNGLTDHEHPCQAISDLLTMAEVRDLPGATLAYVGDARNNVTHSLLLACAMMGVDVRIACPPIFAPDPDVVARARVHGAASGARIEVVSEPSEAVRGADFVYTDTWMSYHVPASERDERQRILRPYRVDGALMAMAPGARFMHCLPATRGEEVTSAVLDSPASIVLDQAENRLHAQKALLVTLMRPTLARALNAAPVWRAGAAPAGRRA